MPDQTSDHRVASINCKLGVALRIPSWRLSSWFTLRAPFWWSRRPESRPPQQCVDDGQRKPLGLHRPLVRPAGAPPLLHPAGEPFRESAGTPGRRRNALLGLATSAVRCACRPHLRERCVLAKVCEAGIEPQTSRPQAGPLSRVAPSLSTARGSRTSGALRRTRHCWRRSAYRSPRAAPAGSQVSGAPTRCRTPTRSRAGS